MDFDTVISGDTDTPVRVRRRDRALAAWSGVRWAVAAALIVDFFLGGWILNVLLRAPGGGELPALLGLVLAGSVLVRRPWAAIVPALGLTLSIFNVIEFYSLRADGLPAAALPFSFVPALFFLVEATRPRRPSSAPASWMWAVPVAVAAGPALALLHIFTFGATDYTRLAEAIVVFGARAYEDGTPSLALHDRVAHGIRLHARGVAPVIVMSGSAHEVETMRRMAFEAGVPAEAIVDDPDGLNTFKTIANLRHRRIVAVSHYYHLARIKMAARRAGVACYTSPCRMTRRLVKEPYFIARECAALGAYYLFRG